MTQRTLASHFQVRRYGDFTLTDAIRPALDIPVIPREGYRVRPYRDPQTGMRLRVVSASVSAERLFDVFLALLELLSDTVDVVLETSHDTGEDRHVDLRRSDIDLPVLLSHFCEQEELLLNDGCFGVAVIAKNRPWEVQLDEHKIIHIYAPKSKPFRRVLRRLGLRRDDDLQLISEADHIHHTTASYAAAFHSLSCLLGAVDFDQVSSDERFFE